MGKGEIKIKFPPKVAIFPLYSVILHFSGGMARG